MQSICGILTATAQLSLVTVVFTNSRVGVLSGSFLSRLHNGVSLKEELDGLFLGVLKKKNPRKNFLYHQLL